MNDFPFEGDGTISRQMDNCIHRNMFIDYQLNYLT